MKRTVTSLGNPSWIVIRTEGEEISVPYAEKETYGRSGSIHVSVEKNGLNGQDLDIRLQSPDDAVKMVQLRWNVNDINGVRIYGDAWERSYCDLEWRGISARRILPWYFLANRDGWTAGYGVKVRPNAFCFFEADTRGITLYMDVRCGGEGVRLGERALDVCTVLSRIYEDCSAYEASRAFCGEMCTDPILPDRPIYGSNNWYYAYGVSSRENILRDSDYIVRLSEGNPVPPYMVIDDGWQPLHSAEYNGGPWRDGNADYGDMGALAADIAAKGAVPGIWFRPLFNRDPAIPDDWRLETGYLDPSVPDVLTYIQEDIRTIAGWGYRLIKHDFSTFDLFGKWGFEMHPLVTDDGWHFHDRGVTSAEVVKKLYSAIHEAAEPYGALILGCDTVGHLGAGLMQIARTGDDTSGLGWERTRSVGVNTLAFRLMQNETFFLGDADCVGITGAIPWELNRQFADVIARTGTALFVSAKPGVLTEEEEKDLHEILRMASEGRHRAYPRDWLENDCPDNWVDGGRRTISYSWYEERGTVFDGNRWISTPFMTGY